MIATERWERQLDDFDRGQRSEALTLLWRAAERGEIALPEPGRDVNLHAHTFFSYNAYGYSPSKFAWLARKAGLAVAGIVDFDVLDGVEEFFDVGREIGLKCCAGLESRVFVPEFATLEINSPGEPGVAYNMGVGFPRAASHAFLAEMRAAAKKRTRGIIERVNAYLDPVRLDFDADVAPLTPGGNATERHLCEAYERKAIDAFPDAARRAAFWTERLGGAPGESAKLQGLIRAKTMKQGGVGYVAPDRGSFPEMAKMNHFVAEAGAIPTVAWLDGASEGERRMDEFVDIAIASGAAALNVIPDRNYTPGKPESKLKNLYEVVALAERRGFPVIAGTEMNAPGQKFVEFVFVRRTEAAGADVSAQRPHRLCAHGSAARTRTRLPQSVGQGELLVDRDEERILRRGRSRPAARRRKEIERDRRVNLAEAIACKPGMRGPP